MMLLEKPYKLLILTEGLHVDIRSAENVSDEDQKHQIHICEAIQGHVCIAGKPFKIWSEWWETRWFMYFDFLV